MKWLCMPCSKDLGFFKHREFNTGTGDCYECQDDLKGKRAFRYSVQADIRATCPKCEHIEVYPHEACGEKFACEKCQETLYLGPYGYYTPRKKSSEEEIC